MNEVVICSSLEEVRSHIDRVDLGMVALLAERGAYVRQAARLKKSPLEIPAPARVEAVLAKVEMLAVALGANPAVAEATWKAMIAAFIEAERVEYLSRAAKQPPST